jgi:hypothetical protein
MKKLIQKLKRFLKRTEVEFVIEYTNPLNIAQFSEILNKMINKFPGGCKPHSISGSPNSTKVTVKFSDTCMTVDELTHIGNSTIERIAPSNPVKSVTMNQY